MLYKIRCNPMHSLYGSLDKPYVPVRVNRDALVAHRYTYAPPRCEHRCTAGFLFHCQYLCGTILVTPHSKVWNWRVSRAGPMHFYRPSSSLHFCPLLFSLPLLSFYVLVLWGWGLWTEMMLIAFTILMTLYSMM